LICFSLICSGTTSMIATNIFDLFRNNLTDWYVSVWFVPELHHSLI
jgi:hypothetical protein